jgi:hypothetical protein
MSPYESIRLRLPTVVIRISRARCPKIFLLPRDSCAFVWELPLIVIYLYGTQCGGKRRVSQKRLKETARTDERVAVSSRRWRGRLYTMRIRYAYNTRSSETVAAQDSFGVMDTVAKDLLRREPGGPRVRVCVQTSRLFLPAFSAPLIMAVNRLMSEIIIIYRT